MLNPLHLCSNLERVGAAVEGDLIGNIEYIHRPVPAITAAHPRA